MGEVGKLISFDNRFLPGLKINSQSHFSKWSPSLHYEINKILVFGFIYIIYLNAHEFTIIIIINQNPPSQSNLVPVFWWSGRDEFYYNLVLITKANKYDIKLNI